MSAHAEIAAFLAGDDLAARADAAASASVAAAIDGGGAASVAASAFVQHGGTVVGGSLLVPTSDATIYKLGLAALEAPGMHAEVRPLEGGLVAVTVTLSVPTVAACVVPAAEWARAMASGK